MITPLSTPFPRSYWVIPKQLLAGPYPGSMEPQTTYQRIAALLGCGIVHVINLMEPDEVDWQGRSFLPYIEEMRAQATFSGSSGIGWSRYPIRDGGIPSHQVMRCILDEVDTALATEKPVYIHCWGGRGRTGTVVGCFLARHQIAHGQAALDQIVDLRRAIQPYQISPETEEQFEFVRNWLPGE